MLRVFSGPRALAIVWMRRMALILVWMFSFLSSSMRIAKGPSSFAPSTIVVPSPQHHQFCMVNIHIHQISTFGTHKPSIEPRKCGFKSGVLHLAFSLLSTPQLSPKRYSQGLNDAKTNRRQVWVFSIDLTRRQRTSWLTIWRTTHFSVFCSATSPITDSEYSRD